MAALETKKQRITIKSMPSCISKSNTNSHDKRCFFIAQQSDVFQPQALIKLTLSPPGSFSTPTKHQISNWLGVLRQFFKTFPQLCCHSLKLRSITQGSWILPWQPYFFGLSFKQGSLFLMTYFSLWKVFYWQYFCWLGISTQKTHFKALLEVLLWKFSRELHCPETVIITDLINQWVPSSKLFSRGVIIFEAGILWVA